MKVNKADELNITRKNRNPLIYTFQKLSPVFILILLAAYMSFANENFLSASNFVNIIRQSSVLGIIAIGQTLVILTAGIDLSVGSTMALSGCIMAVLSTQFNFSPALAVVVSFIIGTFVGVLNGLIITKLKIQPFIATLGILTVGEGIALLVTDGLPISGITDELLVLGSGNVWGIPISVFVFTAIALMGIIILKNTTLGRNIVAIGGNEEASRTSGIKVDRTKIVVYSLAGFCCSVAGFVMVGRLNSANALMGGGIELLAITAVALGGTSLSGGIGGVGGTIIGIVTIGVLNNGLDLLNTTPFWQKVILGIMIIAVVALDSWRSRKFKD
jgi:ribose/xylose/arabinose/galactoside ABC-type transport system permease subunit